MFRTMSDVQQTDRVTGMPQGLLASIAAAGFMLSGAAHAVSIDAGDYTTLPGGTDLQVYYAQFAETDELRSDGNTAVDDAEVQSAIGIYRYVHYIDVEGFGIIDPQILVPFGSVSTDGALSGLNSTFGIADPILAVTWWPFSRFGDSRHFGITPFVWVPIGSYNRTEPINVGENRWKAALQFGYIHGFGDTGFIFDVSADVQIHGTNDEFFAGTDQSGRPLFVEREQDEIYDIQTFFRYKLGNPGVTSDEVNLRVRYVTGGEETIGGVEQDNRQETLDLMLTYMEWVGADYQLLFQVGRDFSREEGLREDYRFQFRILIPFLPEG